MIYRFGGFELDEGSAELRRVDGPVVPVEPQVLRLLTLLAENGARLTSTDAIVDRIWHGAPISDAAIASHVRSARAALGDDGRRQEAIRTVRGRGYRLEWPVSLSGGTGFAPPGPGEGAAPSIGVLAFDAAGADERARMIGPALAHEVIVSLSLTRSLTVIARASSFQLATGAEAGERLDVDYVLTGRVEIDGRRIAVSPVLVAADSGVVIWADRMVGGMDDIFALKSEVTDAVVAAAEIHVPRDQAQRARTRGLDALDAWSAFHLGLNHIYRFTAEDNARSAVYFRQALALAPDFARAHAGLSFVAFQRAFTGFDADRTHAADEARACAERAMELAPEDPFSNLVLGRSYWVRGDLDAAAQYLETAVALNPNYAQGHYSLGLVQALNGESRLIDRRSDLATRLSPLDPLLYGMHGMKAWARLNKGEFAGAADWGERSARTPGAHFLIDMLAAMLLELDGRAAEARTHAERARARRPDATFGHFFSAFPLPAGPNRRRSEAALAKLGF